MNPPALTFFTPRAVSTRLFKLALLFLIGVLALSITSRSGAQKEIIDRPFDARDKGAAKDRRTNVPGEILVRFRSGATATKRARTSLRVQSAGRDMTLEVERFGGSEIVEGLRLARVNPVDTGAAIDALRARADVEYAEPNLVRHAFRLPNDPRFPQMWGLKNTGQASTSGGNPGSPGKDIHAETAWDVTTGSRSIVVGVIDSGIDINHEDLRDNIWINPAEIAGNGIDDDGNGYIDDIHGWDFAHDDNTVFDYTSNVYPPPDTYTGDVEDHGTHVAGTIGAVGDNGIGTVGVNWQVSLLPLKFLTGPQGFGSAADALEAYAYAKQMRDLWASSGGARGANIRVLNNSYGGGGFLQSEFDAIRSLGNSGILFVVAAGNEGFNNDYFPAYPSNYLSANLISVAASTGGGTKASFSNFGPATVHMTAPGEHILSTTPLNTYEFFSGTSMSAPHVAGGAALVAAANPNLSLNRLRNSILYGGYIAPWQGIYSYNISTGRHHDANGSLQSAASNDTTAPGPLTNFNVLFGAAFPNYNLQWTAPGDDLNTGRVAIYQLRVGDSDTINNPQTFETATPLTVPWIEDPGIFQSVGVRIPWRHSNSVIGVRAIDEVGNAGPISTVPLGVADGVSDPYTMTLSAPSPLSTGGTPMNLVADDEFKNVTLPIAFPFFGANSTVTNVWLSSNGGIYVGPTPSIPLIDAFSSVRWLNGFRMIAGAWEDLRTDRRPGDDVYMVVPNEDTVIFRWQAVTYDYPIGPGMTRGENPVNFEVELQRTGTIIIRYGDGNQKMFPVVGLGGGYPEPYVVASHTSENALKDLTNAQTVTFALKIPPPPPTADVSLTMTSGPNPVQSGGQETYNVQVYNNGPFDARNTTVTDQLPAGLNFVSCTTNRGTCSGPSPGTNGTVTVNLGQLDGNQSATITMVTQVAASGGATISNTVSVSNTRFDNNLGNNSATATAQVVQMSVFGNVRSISASKQRSFAVKNDGTLWGWGRNDYGAFGDGTFYSDHVNPVPLEITGITAVSSGILHTLALKSDGTVAAWGYNSYGQVYGDGAPHGIPFTLPGITNITTIAAGYQHSLILRNDGTVLAWGANNAGQLGQGTSDGDVHGTPAVVPGLTNVTAIAAASDFSFAVKNDGTLWGWGRNISGVLGPANVSGNQPTPVQISGIANVRAISASFNHVLAIKTDGTVWGWGMNLFGQTGAADLLALSPTPTQVSNLTNIVSVGAGFGFSMAVRGDGTMWGWGQNGFGQLGSGTTSNNPQYIPSQVSGITSATSVATGESHVVALLGDGTVRSWGDNQYAQLGDGTNFNRSLPVQVSGVLQVSQPIMWPGSQTNYPPIVVTITCSTSGSVIHYTTNGQDPTENDPVVASGGSVQIMQTATLKARAFKQGWLNSPISAATYTVLIVPNPIDTSSVFVRQQYLDFLNREPDQGGWDYWTSQITSCGPDQLCIHQRRIGVSAAFFVELEFQRTGYVVYRMHRAAFGTWPSTTTRANLTFTQFMADRPLLPEGTAIEQSTIAFANDFVQRQTFLQQYPASLSNADFVNRLFDKADLLPYTAERQQQIDAMNNTGRTRAQVMLQLIEIPEFKTREYNRSFVLMEYFGYLRRDPDQGGYDFWLNILNNRVPDNYRSMVCAFLTSAEYQQRFGTNVSRTNADCAQ